MAKSILVRSLTAACLLLLIAQGAYAQEKEEVAPFDEPLPELVTIPSAPPKMPLWEAGLFGLGVSQPAYPGSDERVSRLLGLPYMIYRGEYLRVDRGTVGVRAIHTDRTELDVGFAASLGSKAEDVEARRGMDDLGTLLEFGPRLNINLGDISKKHGGSRLQFPLRGVFDANDNFRFRGYAFEPQWVTDMNAPKGWLVSTSLGALLGDQKLADTFYRVSPAEANSLRPSYEAKSGLIALRASLFVSHLVSQDVRFFSFVRLDSVNGAANYNSPLVRRDNGWAVGVGIAWRLARSDAMASD